MFEVENKETKTKLFMLPCVLIIDFIEYIVVINLFLVGFAAYL